VAAATMSRELRLRRIALRVLACRRCPGMNIQGVTQAAPGWGNPYSPVVFVGQSLCHACMETQVPFTGGSGRLLDMAFDSIGVPKCSMFFTNVVHCHPPANRPSRPDEIQNCRRFLHQELGTIAPRLVIGLGRDAAAALFTWASPEWPRFRSGGELASADPEKALLYIYHPAYLLRSSSFERKSYVEDLALGLKWCLQTSRA
jgi:uracil-DNA glycosylase family 4